MNSPGQLLGNPPRVLLFQFFTVSRFFFAVAFAFLLPGAGHSTHALLACLGLVILAELTDLLDGPLARRFGLVSKLGAMLDAYTDSLTRLVIYWALAWAGLVLPVVPLVMALRDVSVAYCRIVLALNGESVSARMSGKAKAMAQTVGALLAVTGPFYWDRVGDWPVAGISWMVMAVTVGSIAEYALAARGAARR